MPAHDLHALLRTPLADQHRLLRVRVGIYCFRGRGPALDDDIAPIAFAVGPALLGDVLQRGEGAVGAGEQDEKDAGSGVGARGSRGPHA